MYPHAHALAPDGVFVPTADGMRFFGLGPPTRADIKAIVERTEARIGRVLARRSRPADLDEATRQLELLLSCSRSPATRVSAPVASPRARRSKRRDELCARSPGGLELHAAVRVRAADRAGLERLCRYIARPPVPEQRLSRLSDGSYRWQLKRTWKGGVKALVYEPLALLSRLAALIPLPRTQLRRFYGVFGPAHAWRAAVVPTPPDPDTKERPVAPKRPARMAWADLLRRVWNIDALRCTRCAGRMIVVGVVEDPDAIEAILAAIHMSDAAGHGDTGRPRGPPQLAAA